jgi:hypothetical protein
MQCDNAVYKKYGWKCIYMGDLERLRAELNSVIKLGNKEEILKVSQELDSAILEFLRENGGQASHINQKMACGNKM